MLVAFIGSHGTGKTTTCTALHKQLGKQWPVFEDAYRKQSRLLGYKRPRETVHERDNKAVAVTAMAGTAMGALQEWSQKNKRQGLIDLGPPALLAYHRYWMKICDTPVSPFLLKMCRHISDQVDLYIYLPTETIPLVSDNMRNDDPIFQKDIDQWVKRNLAELNIPSEKILIPKAISVEGRVNEILKLISL